MKQPNWKTPLILSAALLVIGTFAYWLQYSHKPKKDKSELQTKKPIALAADDTQVALIKIKNVHGLIELKCESLAEKKCNGGSLGKWVITNPKSPSGEFYVADASSVKEYLNTVTTSVSTEVIDLSEETPEKRKALFTQYGLSDEQRPSPATLFVELIEADDKGNAGKRHTAWFGAEHPIGDKTFVASAVDGAVNEKTVFLLSNHTKTSYFSKSLTNFREKALFTFDRQSITEFKSGKLTAKKINGAWIINGHPGSFDHIETVLSAISNAKAIEFVDKKTIQGLKPIITYDLKAGEKNYSLAIYEKKLAEKKVGKEKLPAEKHYYAQSSEKKELVEVESILRSNIDKSLNDLRNTILFTDAEKVTATRMKVEAKGYSASPEFQYNGKNWTAVDPTKNWEPAIASKLIDIFAITRIKDFVSPPPAGKELMKISIGDEKNPNKFHYSIVEVKDNLYARNLNEKNNEAYLMESSMKLALPKSENEWKIKTPTK